MEIDHLTSELLSLPTTNDPRLLLGITKGRNDAIAINNALRRRLAQLHVHPSASSTEAQKVRIHLHSLRDNLLMNVTDSIGTSKRTAQKLTPLDKAIIAALVSEGGWNSKSRSRLVGVASAYSITVGGLTRILEAFAVAARNGRGPLSSTERSSYPINRTWTSLPAKPSAMSKLDVIFTDAVNKFTPELNTSNPVMTIKLSVLFGLMTLIAFILSLQVLLSPSEETSVSSTNTQNTFPKQSHQNTANERMLFFQEFPTFSVLVTKNTIHSFADQGIDQIAELISLGTSVQQSLQKGIKPDVEILKEWNNIIHILSQGWMFIDSHTLQLAQSHIIQVLIQSSMVLYETNCATQVACNGDAFYPDADNCQQFYSKIAYELVADETYYIRIGGWHAEAGQGTLTIGLVPDPVPGACCYSEIGKCFTLVQDICETSNGQFMGEGVDCSDALCVIVIADDCEDAVTVTIGEHAFSTFKATPSLPYPSDSSCPDSYLGWDSSPDIWLHWTAPDDGIATFSTCDDESYDTSIVLYENTCTNQIACNGDAAPSTDCQIQYSLIEYPVSANTTYFIRIGGWQGQTGDGTLTISLDGDNDVAPCCYQGDCYANQLESECSTLGGTWILGETCKTFNCDSIPCHSSIFMQTPHSPEDSWQVGNASSDSSNGISYIRTEHVSVSTLNTITVWGFQAYLDGSWSSCNANYAFTIRTYEDDNNVPGPLVSEDYQVAATMTSTGTLYAGVYELIQFDLPFQSTNVEHISVQSESNGHNCWFLWLSSGSGDGISYVNTGSGWTISYSDLSICVE